MAVLQQIRVKFGLVISIIIALALLSFIIDVNTLESALNMMSSKYDVGEIAGKSISYTDFQGDVERLTNINEIVTGSSASNEEIQNQIRNAAWQELVYKYLFIKNAKAAGVNVGEDEMVALTTGDIISPVIAQDPVFAGEDGTFSKDVLINLVQNINQDASGQIKTYWNYVQNTVLINQYYTKYADLFMKSNFQTPLMTRNAVAENNNTTDVDFVLVPLNPYVTDSTVVVTSDEIKKFYNDHKKMFKQNASRDIEYVVFEVKPSDDDIKATNEAFTKSYDEFLTVEAADMKKFISKNSSRPYTGYWYKDGELSTINTDLSEFVAANTTGVSPIITNGTTFYAAKILATAMMPDEVFVKHILLTGTDAKTKAEEILREVNADNFSSLAAEYSEDQNSAADGELGSLGWMSQTNMINGFESVLEAQVGRPFIIETIYGTSVVLVTEKSEPVLKKQVAVLEKESIPSKQTYNEWYSKANNFATLAHGSYDNYKKAVESEGVYSHPDVNVLESRTTYGSIDGAKELTRWVFETKPGKVSDIITVNTNYFFVATVTGVHKEGYADVKEVASSIQQVLYSEKYSQKMADEVAQKINGLTSLEAVAEKLGTTVSTQTDVTFASLTSQGLDPKFIGAISAAPVNKLCGPVAGTIGVYVFEVKNHDTAAYYTEDDAKTYSAQQNNYFAQTLISVMMDDADVKDNRARFY